MIHIKKSALFIGSNSKNWKPNFSRVTEGFLKTKICFVPKFVIDKLNCLLSIIYKVLILNKFIWIIDADKKYKRFMDLNLSMFCRGNVFYLTSVNKGFLTNKTINCPTPCLVLFSKADSHESLIKSLKDKGVMCAGITLKKNTFLDYGINFNDKGFDVFKIILYYILYIVSIKSNEKI